MTVYKEYSDERVIRGFRTSIQRVLVKGQTLEKVY